MAATRQDISEWFDRGVAEGATHMIVACDTFDWDNWDDYPKYVLPGQDVREVEAKCQDRIMEVYALHLPKDAQMAERRAFHYDTPPLIEEDPI